MTKGFLKKAALASLLTLLPMSFSSCGKSEISTFFTKLPDGRVKIEYEKLVKDPWEEPIPYGSMTRNASESEKGINFWLPKGTRGIPDNGFLGRGASLDDFNNVFFERTSFKGEEARVSSSMNPDDGIPEILVVAIQKRIVKGSIEERADEFKDEKEFTGFSAYVFLDRDYMKKSKNPSLYFMSDSGNLFFVKHLNPKGNGILFEKIDADEALISKFYLPNLEGGYCPAKAFRPKKISWNGIKANQPAFFIGETRGENPKMDSDSLENPLHTVFGIFDSHPRASSKISQIGNYKQAEEGIADAERIIKECFDEVFQSRLSIAYEQALRDNPNAQRAIINPGTYKACLYSGWASSYPEPIFSRNGEGLFSIISDNKVVRMKVQKVEGTDKWNVIEFSKKD